MPKRKKNKNQKKGRVALNKKSFLDENTFSLSKKIKRITVSVIFFLFAIIVGFSLIGQSGLAGEYLKNLFLFFVGHSVFIIPIILVLIGIIVLKTRYNNYLIPTAISASLTIFGLSGILNILSNENSPLILLDEAYSGGFIGQILGGPLSRFFDFWISVFILFIITAVSFFVFLQFLIIPPSLRGEDEGSSFTNVFKRIIRSKSKFTINEVNDSEDISPRKEEIKTTKTKDGKNNELKISEKLVEKSDIKLPPVNLLEPNKGIARSGDTKANSEIIKRTLENFDIPVEMSEIKVGPTVTQYTLKPSEGIKLSKITSLSNDLSLSLAAHSIRIEAPIPGRSLVGVEIPNKIRAEIRLRELIEEREYSNSSSHLPLVMGQDVSGTPTYTRLEKMPHMIVAGATGSGKTIFLNTLIMSLMFKNSPKTLRLILVDPKRVEFSNYEGAPYLLCPVIFDVNRTCNALKWLVGEMERRLKVMSENKVRDIGSYNKLVAKSNKPDMEYFPYIVLVVDELADLMVSKGKDIEAGIVRLAQMARAAGIHLILATQRPSVEVITGLIKANIISRVAFQVASQIDSRTILDIAGAEKLLGAGDMLYITGNMTKPKRVQAPYVSEKEIRDIVKWVKLEYNQIDNESELSDEIEAGISNESGQLMFDSNEDDDPLYEEARILVTQSKKASASFLQRRLKIGYARAARLIDIMEDRGIVGPPDGAKPREVYIKDEEVEGWKEV